MDETLRKRALRAIDEVRPIENPQALRDLLAGELGVNDDEAAAIIDELEDQGLLLRSSSSPTAAEDAPPPARDRFELSRKAHQMILS